MYYSTFIGLSVYRYHGRRCFRTPCPIVVRSRPKCQRQRPDPAKGVGSGLRSQIGPLARRGIPGCLRSAPEHGSGTFARFQGLGCSTVARSTVVRLGATVGAAVSVDINSTKEFFELDNFRISSMARRLLVPWALLGSALASPFIPSLKPLPSSDIETGWPVKFR